MRAATPVEAADAESSADLVPDLVGDRQSAILTDLVELPPPSGADFGVGPWQPFIDYALEQGAALAETDGPQSALIVPDGLMISPQRRPCRARHPAVILDLDRASAAFAPGSPAQPQPGLATGLVRLRDAGIVILWLSRLSAARVSDVAGTLRATGLDPEGKDQFLLIRHEDDRKQLLREQANEDVCVIAIAGDERSDFDELFEYLRDPDAAAGLDAMLGDGWFLVPPPL